MKYAGLYDWQAHFRKASPAGSPNSYHALWADTYTILLGSIRIKTSSSLQLSCITDKSNNRDLLHHFSLPSHLVCSIHARSYTGAGSRG